MSLNGTFFYCHQKPTTVNRHKCILNWILFKIHIYWYIAYNMNVNCEYKNISIFNAQCSSIRISNCTVVATDVGSSDIIPFCKTENTQWQLNIMSNVVVCNIYMLNIRKSILMLSYFHDIHSQRMMDMDMLRKQFEYFSLRFTDNIRRSIVMQATSSNHLNIYRAISNIFSP